MYIVDEKIETIDDLIINEFLNEDDIIRNEQAKEKLVKEGKVLCPEGSIDLRYGGIFNFITEEPSDIGVGLSNYIFNKEHFLSSKMFNKYSLKKCIEITEQIEHLEDHVNSLKNLKVLLEDTIE